MSTLSETRLTTTLSDEVLAALDAWIAGQNDPLLTRSHAVRVIVTERFGFPAPVLQPPKVYDSSARDAHIAALHRQLGTYKAVAAATGLSAGRVAQLIARHRRRLRNAADDARGNGD